MFLFFTVGSSSMSVFRNVQKVWALNRTLLLNCLYKMSPFAFRCASHWCSLSFSIWLNEKRVTDCRRNRKWSDCCITSFSGRTTLPPTIWRTRKPMEQRMIPTVILKHFNSTLCYILIKGDIMFLKLNTYKKLVYLSRCKDWYAGLSGIDSRWRKETRKGAPTRTRTTTLIEWRRCLNDGVAFHIPSQVLLSLNVIIICQHQSFYHIKQVSNVFNNIPNSIFICNWAVEMSM